MENWALRSDSNKKSDRSHVNNQWLRFLFLHKRRGDRNISYENNLTIEPIYDSSMLPSSSCILFCIYTPVPASTARKTLLPQAIRTKPRAVTFNDFPRFFSPLSRLVQREAASTSVSWRKAGQEGAETSSSHCQTITFRTESTPEWSQSAGAETWTPGFH